MIHLPDDAPDDRSACPPCRGTGKVTSTQGGEAHDVTCPWCEGSGRRVAVSPAD